MKRILSLIALSFISFVGFSQTKGISYQAVIIDPNPIEIPGKDVTAQPYVSKDVWIRFGIYSGTTLQYEELHKTKTDEYGLVNLIIGAGVNTGKAGTFTSLSWDGVTKNIITNVSFDQGGRYTEVSNQKLTYVPYSLLSETAVKLAGVLPVSQGGTGATNAIAARTNLGLGNVDNTADVDKPVSIATLAILDTKEAISNKSTNIIADSASSVKYPSVKAIKDYIDSRNSASANSARLAAKATALETPRTINGIPFDGTANITIPVGVTPPDADANTKGLVQLAGDLTGTAVAPTIASAAVSTAKIADGAVITGKLAAGSVTTAKVADGAITDAKITSVAGSKVTGNIAGNAGTATKLAAPKNINGVPFDGTSDITISANASTLSGTIAIANGGTGATTAAGARTNLGLVIGTDVLAQRTFGTAANSAASDFVAATEKGANNGVATLGVNGKIPSTQIPAISFQNVNVVNSDASMTAIVGAQVGSIAIRTDNNNNYVLSALPASTLSNWIALATPLYVSTVNGYAGPNVSLTTNDVPEGTTNKYYTDARVRNAITATGPLNFNASTGVLSMTTASTTSGGFLTASDYTNFNNKQTALTAGVDYATPGGNITGNAANVTGIVSIANGGTGASTAGAALTNLGAEPSANKSNDILVDGNSTTKFPTFKAIKDYVDQQSANAGVADNSITSAKINGTLAVLKGGTGASTPAGARTNLGLVIGTDVMAANFTTTLTGDVTGSGNGSFATTLANSGVISGTYGSSTAIPTLTVDSKGRITSAGTVGIIAGVNSLNYTSTTSYATGGTISGTSLTLAAADGTNPGLISTGAQTIGGAKTFSNDVTAPNFIGNASTATTAGNITATSNTTITSLANLNSVGTITSGTWSATEIAIAKGGTGATTAAGARANLGLTIGTDVQAPLVSGTDYIAPNASITGATKTKITYDAKGLVTAGTDATTADIAPSTNRNYVTDAQAGVISNTSGINTGDQTITLTGDVTGSGTGSFATTLTDSGVSSGTYGSSTAIPVLTVDSKGRLTSASTVGIIAGVNTLNYTSTTSYAAGGTISGTTLTLAAADATNPGLISTGTQTIAGAKTFSNTTTFNTDVTLNGLTLGKGKNSLSGNVAFGSSVLSTNTTGNYNTAIGNKALSSNLTGGSNTGIGHFALLYNQTGVYNTGVGSNALSGIVSGNSNSAFGAQAMPSMDGGTGNTSIGSGSFYNILSGSNNISLGYNAAQSYSSSNLNLTNANNGIFIGTSTRAGVNSSTNEVVIGHQALGNGSNTVTIGNSSITDNYFRGNINLTGNISGGTWSGTTIGSNYGGAGTVNGLLKANGSGVVSAAVAGTDYMAANATTTLTGDVTGSGSGTFTTTINSVGGVSSSTISGFDARITTNANNIALRATIASPSFTGTPTAPTPTTGDNSTKIATTEYVQASITAANAGVSSVGPISATANANGATISGSSQLILTPASASFGGVVTTAAQTFAGAKTFSNTATFNSDITVNGIKIGLGNNAVSTNTGVGYGTLGAVTSQGSDLTALGYNALTSNTSGYGNTAIGQNSLLLNTTGFYNTAVGKSALSSNVQGQGNFAGGMEALKANTSGHQNTSVGSYSLNSNTTGGSNTALGYWSLRNLYSSSGNTALGTKAGEKYGSGTGTNLTAATNSVFIGANTRASADAITNEVVIGADAVGNGSNTVTVGNLSNTATFFTGNINLTGNVVGGTWSGTTIGSNYGGAGTVNGLLKANGSGVVSAAISGTDFQAPLTAGSGISIASGTISATGLTSANLSSTAGITNSQLATSTTTLGSTTMTLGGTVTSVTGLTSLSSTTFVGTLSGTASTANTLTTSRAINGISFDGSADITIAANSNTLTGTTLASNVVNSSLTGVGTITSGVWSGTTIDVAHGGTGLTSLTAGYIPYGNGTGAFASNSGLFWDSSNARLGVGTSTPTTKFEVNGSFRAGGLSYPTSDGTAGQYVKTDGSGNIGFTSNIMVPSYSTTNRDAGTFSNGMLIYNTTAGTIQASIPDNSNVVTSSISNSTGSASFWQPTYSSPSQQNVYVQTFTTPSVVSLTSITLNTYVASSPTTVIIKVFNDADPSNGLTNEVATISKDISSTSMTNMETFTLPSSFQSSANSVYTFVVYGINSSNVFYVGTYGSNNYSGGTYYTSQANTSYTSTSNLSSIGLTNFANNDLKFNVNYTSGASGSKWVDLLNNVDLSTNVTGSLPIANGGTGATTASDARTNLGLGSLATKSTIANADVASGAAIDFAKLNITKANITSLGIQDGLTAGSGISLSSGTISVTGLTTSNLASNAAITNGQLANSSTTLGSTTMTLGGTVTSVTGLVSVSSTGFTGALTGNASTATKLAATKNINGVAFDGSADITVTADAGTLTGTTLNSTVTSSSLTGVGTITSGTWNASTISAARGGTGLTSPGTSGNILTSNGTAWVSSPISAVTSLGTFTTTSYANGGTLSGTNTLLLSAADATNPGLLTAGTQTIGGAKTFSNTTTFNSDVRINSMNFGQGTNSNRYYKNVAIGTSVLNNYLSTGGNGGNTGVGNDSFYSLTSGDFNTAIGTGAIYKNKTGSNNTAVGFNALYGNTSGGVTDTHAGNSAFGSNAISGITSGSYNSAFGNYSQQYLQDGGYNTSLGSNSLLKNVSGNYNVAIGSNSGMNNTGSSNIFIGYRAGASFNNGSTSSFDNSGGTGNILIGNDVRPGNTNQNNQVVIAGYDGSNVTIGLGSNTTLIGNTATQKSQIYGALTVVPNSAPSTTDGNSILLQAQNAGTGGNNNGGNITLTPGTAQGTGTAGQIQLAGATTITGAATISNTTASNSTTSGALVVRGGVGMAGNLTIGGTIEIDGGSPGVGKVLTSNAGGLASWTSNPNTAIISVTSSTTYTVATDDKYVIYSNGTTGTITLPSAVSVGSGKEYIIKNISANSITVNTTSTQKIIVDNANNTATSVSLGIEASNNWIRVISDGTQWIGFRALF